jgi:hypothetical protein
MRTASHDLLKIEETLFWVQRSRSQNRFLVGNSLHMGRLGKPLKLGVRA